MSSLVQVFSPSLIYSREREALAKGECGGEGGDVPSHIKKKRILERIHEWEKFEANCQKLRELDEETFLQISQLQSQKREGAQIRYSRRVSAL